MQPTGLNHERGRDSVTFTQADVPFVGIFRVECMSLDKARREALHNPIGALRRKAIL